MLNNSDLQQTILKELGIDELPPERQEEILTIMTGAILKRIALRLLSGLSEAQQEQFKDIAASGDSGKVNQFFVANVSSYENAVQDEVAKFKSEMAATVDSLLA